MPSTFSTSNRIEKPAPGEFENTWAERLNDNVIEMIDESLDGVLSFTLSGTKVLTTADAQTDEARHRALNITGGSGGTITIPNVQKMYVVRNGTSGTVTITTGSGTTGEIPAGAQATVISSGSNEVYAGIYASASGDFGATNITGTGTATFASYKRAARGTGYLNGNIADKDSGSNPIFIAEGTPTDTALGNIYGCGYARTGSTSFLTGFTYSGSGWGLYVAGNGTARVFLDGDTGAIHGVDLRVSNTKVVGARRTGWTSGGATLNRGSFSDSTVTLQQLAQRVAALVTDLEAHGLIGA